MFSIISNRNFRFKIFKTIKKFYLGIVHPKLEQQLHPHPKPQKRPKEKVQELQKLSYFLKIFFFVIFLFCQNNYFDKSLKNSGWYLYENI